MKKHLTDGVTPVNSHIDETLSFLPSLRFGGGCADDQRKYHGAYTKSPGNAGAFLNRKACSVIATGKHGDQVQQVNENVENVEIQSHRRANVVGLATLNNAAGIKQYQAGHDHDDYR